MSEETVGALFEYPYNQYLMTRLEFVLIANDELEAKIMRIIEVEMLKVKAIWQRAVLEAIEKKQEPPPEPEEYWVTMSRGLFIAFLYKFDTSVVGAKHPNSISKSSLRRAIDDLIEVKQFLFSRAQPGNEFGATQYTLNREVIQERMRNLPKHPMSLFLKGYSNLETGGVSNLETPTSQKGNSSVSNLATPQFPNLRTLSNSNLDNNNLDKDTYRENVASANSHAPTPLSDEEMIARLQANGYHISQENQPELSTSVVDTPSENVENVEPTRQEDVQTDNKQSVLPIATATTNTDVPEETPPSEQKPARPARQRKPKEEKAKPSLSKEEIKLREEVLTWINAKRGFKLYGRATVKEIQTEYSCSHTLAHMLYVRLHEHNEEEGCTWEDLEYTHEYCSKRDNFWKLPDNKIRIGAFAVLQKFAVAMAFKVQQPLINLEDRRNGVMKQTALEHGSRRSFLEEEKVREQSGIWGDLKKGAK